MSLNDLSKAYEPASVEPHVYRTWLDEQKFTANPNSPGEPYCIVIPPPNVTGALHLGHAINNTLQDILIRRARMQGKNALWIPGIDHAGIATQAVVEKQLKEKEGLTRHDLGREALVKRIWEWKEKFGDRILSQLHRLGCSCDWSRTHFTLDEQCARAVRETFFKLFKDGLIYRGKRLVNWDIALQTSISDDEIYHETVKTNLWHIRYPIVPSTTAPRRSEAAGSPPAQYMTVATTRPETLLGDTAVAVHSEDPRWNWAIGLSVELPLTGRKIPIIADDILVDPKFGSGVVKVTPAHDPNDYAVWQRHQGKPDQIDLINILNPDGTLNENAGPYKGMKRDAARAKVVADLEAQGLLAKTEPYETQVGHSDRSKTPVEPYLSDQWFVKMAPLAEPALQVVRDGTIKFFPERHAQQYLSWLGEKRDWPISRQLWWGHRIPVWMGELKYDVNDPRAGLEDHKRAFEEQCAKVLRQFTDAFNISNDVAFFFSRDQLGPREVRICVKNLTAETAFRIFEDFQSIVHGLQQRRTPEPQQVPNVQFPSSEARAAAHSLDEVIRFIVQDPDVLDTWFSSALWPHSTLGWPDQTADLAKWYPTSVLVTAREIITLWVARMVMTGLYNMKDIPFHHVHIHPVIQDGNGEPMKKSLGNGVDPVDIIDSHGADALRFTLAQMATETQDVRMAVQLVCPHCGHKIPNTASSKETVNCPKCGKPMTRPVSTARATPEAPLARSTSDRFDFGRNFCNKLWNATRFVLTSIQNLTTENTENTEKNNLKEISSSVSSVNSVVNYTLADQWIITRFNRTVAEIDESLKHYRFDQYAKSVYDFFWRDFCDWYVEAAKLQLKDAKTASTTAEVLAACLDGALRLMHPVTPFITERLWWELNEVRPTRGISQLVCGVAETPHVHAGLLCPRLINAPWPTVGPFNEDAEHVFSKLQGLIATIRNLKNEHQANQKIVTVSLAPPGEQATQITIDNKQLIEELAGCQLKEIKDKLPQPPNTIHAIANGACDVYIEGLVDENAEQARIAKRIEELKKIITTLKGRLSNEGYVAKAPPHLIEQTRKQLSDAEAELQKLT
jgi:valyl-tRNA synthetase